MKDDRYEPNDSIELAANLELDTECNAIQNDQDYYLFNFSDCKEYNLLVTFKFGENFYVALFMGFRNGSNAFESQSEYNEGFINISISRERHSCLYALIDGDDIGIEYSIELVSIVSNESTSNYTEQIVNPFKVQRLGIDALPASVAIMFAYIIIWGRRNGPNRRKV